MQGIAAGEAGPGGPSQDSGTFVLELTDGQQADICRETGRAVKALGSNGLGFLAMVMAAEAFQAGADLGIRCPVLLTLTAEQRTSVEHLLRAPAANLLIDPDARPLGYYETWRADVTPFPLGDRLLVVPAGTTAPETADREIIRLLFRPEEHGAFGTGLHATTRISARLVERWIASARAVADVGTGSGILAIAALRLGADSVLALEIDQAAVALAHDNFVYNDVAQRVTLVARELDARVDGPFDLVIANLFPDVLIPLARTFATVVASNGILVVGGVVDNRMADVVDTLQSAGFHELERRSARGWSGAALRRGP